MTWEGHAELIHSPYLCVAGEHEQLSPLIHTERLLTALKGPKRFVVYQDSRHSVGNVPSANVAPFPPILLAHWMAPAPQGKPVASAKWCEEADGRIVNAAL